MIRVPGMSFHSCSICVIAFSKKRSILKHMEQLMKHVIPLISLRLHSSESKNKECVRKELAAGFW